VTERLGAVAATRHCLDLSALEQLPSEPLALARGLKSACERADRALSQRFDAGTDIAELVHARAWVVEQLVLSAWRHLIDASSELELCAVGGFGRGELHPHSDLDLLILASQTGERPEPQVHDALETLIQVLWDAGLRLGHSVRTVSECVVEARVDVGVATNLMESRLLAGSGRLLAAMRSATDAPALWPADEFFAAKCAEQEARHAQFEDTIYNLEPNLKEGPGGLRDIQMIAWVTRRHFKTATLHGLIERGFLSEQEHEDLVANRRMLWSIRWALHELAGRAEERLLFEHQRTLARRFGHDVDEHGNAAVEQFMQRYYRSAMQVAALNERLLQSFDEELLAGRQHLPSADIDDDFQVNDGYLELKDPHAFVVRPELIMRMFLVLSDHPDIRGVRASTIRLVREHLYLIDEHFRTRPDILAMFLKLLRSPRLVYSQLDRMNRYGVLGALLPAFGEITGRMQFDLFHVYTVDQHTLFLIRNLRQMALAKRHKQFAHAIEVMAGIERQEVLYLAALFHDIAKGRGGDHSELGAEDARVFVDQLDIPQEDRDLVVWLVKEHLLMSRTSQREDITDPLIINRFVERVQSQRRLDHLMVLTTADIAATSPKIWNSWKDSLLWELYQASSDALARAPDDRLDREHSLSETRTDAIKLLAESGISTDHAEQLWSCLPERAFLRLDADQLAWASVAVNDADTLPLVVFRHLPEKGISEIFVHAEDFAGLFAVVARELDRMRLNVLAARVVTSDDHKSWDIFQIMSSSGGPLLDADAERLARVLKEQLSAKSVRPLPPRPVPRRLKPFMTSAEIRISPLRKLTCVEMAATDRPGLLSAIAEALVTCEVQLLDARVATFGQRVEDVFLVSDAHGQALTEEACQSLEEALRRQLDAEIPSQHNREFA
jgi:[protein-PII] uridylyltransferase